MSSMAILKTKLPPHCQVKDRGRYTDVYFTIHPKDRPQGWPATIKLGRTDQTRPEEIEAKAVAVYNDFVKFKARLLGIGDLALKKGTLPDVIRIYKASPHYLDLALKTRKDYASYFNLLENWSAKNNHPHIADLTPPAAIKFLNTFENTPIKQRRIKIVLSILCRMAIEAGYIENNPVKDLKLRKRKTEPRKIVIWEDYHIEAFINKADDMGWSSVGTALLMACEIGQRQGDVLKMQKPRDYKDGLFTFRQNKTGKEVRIPATPRLRQRLDALPEEQLLLIRHEGTGKQWLSDTFSHKFRNIADEAGLTDHIFQQARHTAVFNLQRAGCTPFEIGSVTGHSRQTVLKMLDSHYGVDRDEELAQKAITNLNKYRKVIQNKSDRGHTT